MADYNFKSPILQKVYSQQPGSTMRPGITNQPQPKEFKSNILRQVYGQEITQPTVPQAPTMPEEEPGFLGRTLRALPKPILKALSSDSFLVKSPLKPIADKILPAGFGKESERLRKRFIDSTTFGLTGEVDKILGKNIDYRDARSLSDDKLGSVLDGASTIAGYFVPGLGWLKGVKALGLGAKSIPALSKGASLSQKTGRLGKVAAQQAKEGMAIGLGISATEVGVRESLNPQDYTAKENINYIGQNVLMGLALDPLAYGVFRGISKLKQKLSKPQIDLSTETGEMIPPVDFKLPQPNELNEQVFKDLFDLNVTKDEVDRIKTALLSEFNLQRMKKAEEDYVKINELTPEEQYAFQEKMYETVFAHEIARYIRQEELEKTFGKLKIDDKDYSDYKTAAEKRYERKIKELEELDAQKQREIKKQAKSEITSTFRELPRANKQLMQKIKQLEKENIFADLKEETITAPQLTSTVPQLTSRRRSTKTASSKLLPTPTTTVSSEQLPFISQDVSVPLTTTKPTKTTVDSKQTSKKENQFNYIGKSGNLVPTEGKVYNFRNGEKGFYFKARDLYYIAKEDGTVLSNGKTLKEATSNFYKSPKAESNISQAKAVTSQKKQLETTVENFTVFNRMTEKQEVAAFKKIKGINEEINLQNRQNKYYRYNTKSGNFELKEVRGSKEGKEYVIRDMDGNVLSKGKDRFGAFYKLNEPFLNDAKKDIPEYIQNRYSQEGKIRSIESNQTYQQKKADINTQNRKEFLENENLISVIVKSKDGKKFTTTEVKPYSIDRTSVYYLVDKKNKFNIIDYFEKRIIATGDTLQDAVSAYKTEMAKRVEIIKAEDLKKRREIEAAARGEREAARLRDKELPKPRDASKQIVIDAEQSNIKKYSEEVQSKIKLARKFLSQLKKEYDDNGYSIPNVRQENEKFLNELSRINDRLFVLKSQYQESLSLLKQNLEFNETVLSQSERKIFSEIEDLKKEILNTQKELQKARTSFVESYTKGTEEQSNEKIDSDYKKTIQETEKNSILYQSMEEFDINANKDILPENRFRIIDNVTKKEKIVDGKKTKINNLDILFTKNNNKVQAYDYKSGVLIEESETLDSLKTVLNDIIKMRGEKELLSRIVKNFGAFRNELFVKGASIEKELTDIFKGQIRSRVLPYYTPKEIFVMSKYGSWLIQTGFTKSSLWALKMIQKFGNFIRPYLNKIFKNSKNLFEDKISETDLQSKVIKEEKTSQEIKKFEEKKLPVSTDKNIPQEIKNKIVRPDSEMPSQQMNAKSNKFVIDFIDRLSPIKLLSDKIYDLVSDSVRSVNLANNSVYKRQVDLEGRDLGKSLLEILEPVSDNLEEFSRYIVYRASKPRLLKNDQVAYEDKLLNFDEVDSYVKNIEENNPNIALAGLEWNTFFKNIRDILEKENVFTKERLAELEKEFPDYAPLTRDFDEKTSFSILQKIKEGGSKRNVFEPIVTVMEQQVRLYNFLLKNRANQELLSQIYKNPKKFEDLGIKVGKVIDSSEKVDLVKSLQDYEKNKVIKVRQNGKVIPISFDNDDIFNAMINYSSAERSAIINAAEEFTKAVKRSATGVLAPLWSIKGTVMDTSRAIINSDNPMLHLGYLLKASVAPFAPKGSALRKMQEAFEFSGNGMSAALRDSKESRIGSLDFGKSLASKVKRKIQVLNPLSSQSFWGQTADYFENMNRVAAFNFKLDQLKGELTPENIRIASEYARKITTDFTVKGKKSMEMEKFFPYTTASIAGTTQLLRKMKDNPIKTAGIFGATLVMPKLMEFSNFGDDPDYQRLSSREKYRNLIIGKNSEGKFIKIPLDPQFGIVSQLIVETIDAYKNGNPKAYRDAMKELTNIYLPPPVSGMLEGLNKSGKELFNVRESLKGVSKATSLSSVVSVMTNESFTGAPIESLEFQLSSIRPGLRYNEKTSPYAKFIGKYTDFSPMKIDYLLRSFGGDFARYGLPLSADVGSFKAQDFLRNFIADPKLSNNLSSDFYTSRDNLKRARSEYIDKKIPLPNWYDERLYQAIFSQANNSVSKRLTQLRNAYTKISMNKELDLKTKTKKQKEIQELINKTYIDWNNAMYRAGVPNKKY